MILQKEHFTADCRILTMWYSSPTTTHSLRCSQSKQSAASFLGFVSPSSDHRGSRGRSRDLTRESKKLEEIVRKKSFLTDVRSGPSYPAVVTQLYFYSPHTKDKNNNVIKYCIYEAYLALTFQGRHPPQPLLCSTYPKCLVFHHQMSSRLLFFSKDCFFYEI